jgi:phenylacetate-CoA ligase
MQRTEIMNTDPADSDSEPHGQNLDRRLVEAVRYCRDFSEHYRRRLADAGAEPEDITSVQALAQLPVMLEKADEVALQAVSREQLGHPFGEYLCAPLEDVVGVASTSGTTGVPSYYAFTKEDIDTTDAAWGLAFQMAGIRPGDAVVQGFGMSMFVAGYAVVRALERYGARPIPVGAEAGSEKLLRVAEHMRPAAICCTPSYGTYLTEKSNLTKLGIRHVICAGEPGAGLPEVRARLSEGFGGATVTDVLGGVHGVMNVSCSAHSGMHMLGQHNVIQQLIDPDTGSPVELVDGAIGVRVKTTLGWRAQPQLRGSVGDVYEIRTTRCDCGLESPRARVIGRTDDMLIIKGVKLYPAAVQNLIYEMRPHLTGHFRIVLPERGPRVEPPLRMQVEVEAGATDAAAALVSAMHSRFAVTPVVEPLAPGTLPRATLIHIGPAE